jgi:hypothetical protein
VSDRLRRIIGWWQIGCGALGIAIFGAAASGIASSDNASMRQILGPVNLGLGSLYFVLVIVAGVGLLRRASWAVGLSLFCQAVQIVSFAVAGGPQVTIEAGPKVGLSATPGSMTIEAGFNAAFFLGTRVSGVAWQVSINALALAWTAILARSMNRSAELTTQASITDTAA